MYRILLALKPQLLREVWRHRLAEESDVQVVGEIEHEIDLLLAVRATDANVVLHGWNDEQMPPVYTHLLNEFPGLSLIGITPDGERATLCEMRLTRTSLDNSSVEDLLSSLRLEAVAVNNLSLS